MTVSNLLNCSTFVQIIGFVTIFQACAESRKGISDQGSDASVTHDASSTPFSFDGQIESIDDASSQDRFSRDVAMVDSSPQQRDAIFADSAFIDSDLIDSAIESADPLIPVFTCDSDALSADAITTLFQPGADNCGDLESNIEGDCAGHLLVKDSYIYFVREWIMPIQPSRASQLSRVGWLYRMEAKCGAMVEDLGLGWIPTLTLVPPSTNLPYGNAAGFNHLVSGGDFVYLVSDQLYRLDTRDLSHQRMNIDAGCTSDIAANDDEVFVYDWCNQQIRRALHGQNTLRIFSEVDSENLIGDDYESSYPMQGFIAVGTDSLYYSQGNIVWKHALDSTDPTASIPLFTARQEVLALACDDRAVIVVHDHIKATYQEEYLENGCATRHPCEWATVTRVPLDGGEPEDISTMVPGSWPTSGSYQFSDHTIHGWMTPIQDGQVYVRELDDNNVAQVVRIGTDGSGRTPFLRRSNSFLVVDGERLYWTEQGGLFTSMPQSPIPAGPSSSVEPRWVATSGYGKSASTPDNGVVLISGNNSYIEDVNLVKLSAAGVHEWTAQVADNLNEPLCLAVDGEGRITAVTQDTSPTITFHRFEPEGTLIGTALQKQNELHYDDCQGDKEGNIYIFNDPHFEKWSAAGALIWSSDIAPYPNIQGFDLKRIALAEPGIVAVGALPNYNPNEENETFDPGLFAVVRVSDEGRIQWTKRFRMGERSQLTSVATAPDGRVLVSGYTINFVATGSDWVSVPRPFEVFTFMLWFEADGSIESLSLLDGIGMATTVDPNGDVYLLSGGSSQIIPERPFYFEPPHTEGNYVNGLTLAKVKADGTLIRSTELTPFVDDSLPSGSIRFPGRLQVVQKAVVVVGRLYVNERFPGWKVTEEITEYHEYPFVMMFEL